MTSIHKYTARHSNCTEAFSSSVQGLLRLPPLTSLIVNEKGQTRSIDLLVCVSATHEKDSKVIDVDHGIEVQVAFVDVSKSHC